jgi:HSP20 family protein
MQMLIWRRSQLPRGSFEEEHAGLEVAWEPEMDVFELPDEFLLMLCLPGVRAEDLEMALVGRTLVVSGERKLRIPEVAVAHLIESNTGRFERRIRLPANVDAGSLRTEMVDGQLHVSLRKQSPARTVRVSVQAGS